MMNLVRGRFWVCITFVLATLTVFYVYQVADIMQLKTKLLTNKYFSDFQDDRVAGRQDRVLQSAVRNDTFYAVSPTRLQIFNETAESPENEALEKEKRRIIQQQSYLNRQREDYNLKMREIEKIKQALEKENQKLTEEKTQQEEEWGMLRQQARQIEEKKEKVELERKRLDELRQRIINDQKALETQTPPSDMNDISNAADTDSQQRASDEQMQNDLLWLGLNPVEVRNRYPEIELNGGDCQPMRNFIDLNDPDALGMQNQPQSVEDMTDAQAEERFYQLVLCTHLLCHNVRRLGNRDDGGWDMCIGKPYKPQQDNCLVYSIGIGNDFSFDDSISQAYGCLVRAFDPSMHEKDHQHAPNVFFYDMGLGGTNEPKKPGWTVKTLGTILELHQERNKIIDYLKIDIEFDEWTCFQTMLREGSLGNVRLFSFEIHTREVMVIHQSSEKQDYRGWYGILLEIEKQGFRRYHQHMNPSGRYNSQRTGKDRSCCYELYYINIHYLK